MPTPEEIDAIRLAVAWSRAPATACLELRGDRAWNVVDALSPRKLFIQEGQMLQTLFLDEDARPVADLYVCRTEDGFVLLAEGMTAAELRTYIEAHTDAASVTFEDLRDRYDVFELHGPYAWEMLGDLISPEVIGLPYLGFFPGEGFVCFRGGRVGEYGYVLLVEKASSAEVAGRIENIGARYDLREVGEDALALCALENLVFDIRRDVADGLTPIELQLQWRISYSRSYVGQPALTRRRAEATHRAVLVSASGPLAAGDVISTAEGDATGHVIRAAWSLTRKEWLGLASIERPCACPGLTLTHPSGATVRVLSAPAIDNRSVHIDPQRHAYATRAQVAFPPLCPPR